MNEIEIELPQIVLDRADAAYAPIRQQAAQESPAGRRVRSFPRAAGILLAVVILSATAVSAAAVGIVGYRRYMAERMTDIGTEELKCMQKADACHSHGSCIRYRFPSDHA